MDNFEKFLKDKNDLIDGYEPKKGHFERFETRLMKKKKRIKIFSYAFLYKAASVIILLFISALMYLKYESNIKLNEDITTPELALQNISPEYGEVEIYLKSNVSKKIEEFMNLDCENQEFDYESVMAEIKELDNTYNELRKELELDINDERVINAIIECYQNKINLLNRVITIINKNC